MNHEQIYFLMHRNDIVTTISFDRITGSIAAMGKKVNRELLPPGGNMSPVDLRKWWERRAVPLNQGNIRRLLDANQIATPQNYLLQNLGLSLTDHYWINPAEKGYRWEEVNLFANDFRDEFGEYRFRDSFSSENMRIDLQHRTSFYPSASLQGELQKKWVLHSGRRYLVKGNRGTSCQQSINEVIASMIHKKQGTVPYTEYRLCDIQTAEEKSIGCVCENFCTERVEFIPAYEIMESAKKRNEISEYEHFIDVCAIHGMEKEQVRGFLEYQILSDFLLTNADRHFYNFGVLRDSSTLKFVGMAPIFDSGNSMFWNRTDVPEGRELLNISVNSFRQKETELLRYVRGASMLDVTRLPDREEIRALLLLDGGNPERSDRILDGYERKRDLLERFQRGEKIYQYGYLPV